MKFEFKTTYDLKAYTEMAKALRKTVRSKKSRKSHIFGWIVVTLALFLAFRPGEDGLEISARMILTLLVTLIMVAALLWEDTMNGYLALKRTLPGTAASVCTFGKEGYRSETEIGVTEWKYDKPVILAETERYFVFIFSANHAQLYDKTNISGGSAEEFRAFIQEKTGKTIQPVK